MIRENDRLIIVLGMAHSGTTVLTYLLKQHPSVLCCVNGPVAWLLENDWLADEQAEPIQTLLKEFPKKRILLKRAWNEVYHGPWMKREMPEAKFIYCYKTFEAIATSWSRPNSMVDEALRTDSRDRQRQHYDFCRQRVKEFREHLPFFRAHGHANFVRSARQTIADAAAWLGLPARSFDLQAIENGLDVKALLRNRPICATPNVYLEANQ